MACLLAVRLPQHPDLTEQIVAEEGLEEETIVCSVAFGAECGEEAEGKRHNFVVGRLENVVDAASDFGIEGPLLLPSLGTRVVLGEKGVDQLVEAVAADILCGMVHIFGVRCLEELLKLLGGHGGLVLFAEEEEVTEVDDLHVAGTVGILEKVIAGVLNEETGAIGGIGQGHFGTIL